MTEATTTLTRAGSISSLQGNYVRAKQCYEQAEAAGYVPALYLLGVMYLDGHGVKKNADIAFEYFDKAARQGHLIARRERSLMLMRGYRGILYVPIGILGYLKNLVSGIWTIVQDPYTTKAIQ